MPRLVFQDVPGTGIRTVLPVSDAVLTRDHDAGELRTGTGYAEVNVITRDGALHLEGRQVAFAIARDRPGRGNRNLAGARVPPSK